MALTYVQLQKLRLACLLHLNATEAIAVRL